eukprot:434102_1
MLFSIVLNQLLWHLIYSQIDEFIHLNTGALLSINISNNTASPAFTIQINQTNYFESNYFQYNSRNTSSNNNQLKVLSISSIQTGTDFLGLFKYININWSTNWITTIKVYTNKDAIIFQQTFTAKPTNITYQNNKVSMNNAYVFPTICQKQNISNDQLFGILQYAPNRGKGQGGNPVKPYNSLYNFSLYSTHSSAGHIVLSPKIYPSPFTLIYGPMNEFFTQFIGPFNKSPLNNCFASFIPNSFSYDIPNGYQTQTILIAISSYSVSKGFQKNRILMPSSGINAGLYEYGDILLAKSNVKQRPNILGNIGPSNRIKDYIGYSTTAFYFYNPCDCYTFNESAHLECNAQNTAFKNCKTYQDTLIAYNNDMISTIGKTHTYSVMNHLLIDSWWYGEVYYNGVNFWEDNNYYLSQVIKSFPDGLAALWKNMSYASIWAHSGKWIVNNTYQYESQINNNIYGIWIAPAMPQDNKLWNYLFQQSHSWGLSLLKHDHLYDMYDASPYVLTNVSICYNWLSGMNEAALLNNIDVQYSADHPAFYLTATGYASNKYTRASNDYVGSGSSQTIQWAMAPMASVFYGLGIIPYKDTFYSNSTITEKCNNCRLTGYTEYAPWIHAISSLMSGGPLTISDKIGTTNFSLLNMTVRNDGKILKPSAVYMPIQSQWYSMMFEEWPNSQNIDDMSNKPYLNNMNALPNGKLGELYTTYSNIDNYFWYFIWSVQVTDTNVVVTNNDLNINYDNINTQIVIYEWDMNDNKYGVHLDGLFEFVEDTKWNVSVGDSNNDKYGSYTMIVVSQVLYKNGWILLGEIGKVLISPIRMESINIINEQNGEVDIIINGVSNENIKLSFIKWKQMNSIKVIECVVNNEGIVKISINNDQFICMHGF